LDTNVNVGNLLFLFHVFFSEITKRHDLPGHFSLRL
jgi:hypothetical protein